MIEKKRIEELQPIHITRQHQSSRDLTKASEKAYKAGKRNDAYQLSIQATRLAPNDIGAWLKRLALAPSFEERVLCVNHLNELAPLRHDQNNIDYFTVKELLEKDPFLAYVEETDDIYRVINGNQTVVSIRKKRANTNKFSLEQTGPLKTAYRLLVLAFVGLLTAGLGTVIFAPLAGFSAIRAGQAFPSRPNLVNSIVIVSMAIVLFLIGSFFSILFLLHWTG